MALQLWHCEGMHAATCLSARVSTNKEVASAALFLATAVCWIALASFSAPTWGKSLKCLGLSFSFSVLGLFVGRYLFCHRTSSPLDVALSLQPGCAPGWLQVQWLEVRLLPGPHLFWGSGVFWGRFCGLEVASDLLRTSGKRIGAVIFYHHHHHHLQQHQY